MNSREVTEPGGGLENQTDNKGGGKQKDFFSDNLKELLSNNLLFLILIPIVSIVAPIIVGRGFSLKVNILFFFWVLLLTVFVFSLNNLLFPKKKKKEAEGTEEKKETDEKEEKLKIRKSSKIAFFISTILFFIFSVLLLLGCLSEPKKGSLIIYINKNSTLFPDKLFIKRDFPPFLSFLDVRKELKYEPHSKKFSTSEYIRCGNWFLLPYPSDQYEPIVKAIHIPLKKPFKAVDKILFHKRFCNVHFTTIDKDKEPINGVQIEINPIPYGFDPFDPTPSFMKLEMGAYTITFKKEGYKDTILDRTFSAGKEIKVEGTLEKIENESSPTVTPPETPPNSPHNPPRIKIDEIVIYTYMFKQVKYCLQIGDFDCAENILKEIISKHKGTKKAEKAREILEKIRNIKEDKS